MTAGAAAVINGHGVINREERKHGMLTNEQLRTGSVDGLAWLDVKKVADELRQDEQQPSLSQVPTQQRHEEWRKI